MSVVGGESAPAGPLPCRAWSIARSVARTPWPLRDQDENRPRGIIAAGPVSYLESASCRRSVRRMAGELCTTHVCGSTPGSVALILLSRRCSGGELLTPGVAVGGPAAHNAQREARDPYVPAVYRHRRPVVPRLQLAPRQACEELPFGRVKRLGRHFGKLCQIIRRSACCFQGDLPLDGVDVHIESQ